MAVLAQTYEPACPIDSLSEHPANPRVGDMEALGESIRVNGFYGAVVAQVSTRHVLAGNHRLRKDAEQGATTIPVLWVDVDDDLALRILVGDNRFPALAGYDDSGLARLLGSLLGVPAGLLGTGYSADAADLLLRLLAEGDSHGAVAPGLTPGEREEAWAASAMQSLVLPYPPADHDAVASAIDAAGHPAESRSDTVLRLLRAATSA